MRGYAAGVDSVPFDTVLMVRPQIPPPRLTAFCHRATPAEKPRSDPVSTRSPRVMVSSSTPVPVTSPSGVTGVGEMLVTVREVLEDC